MKNIFIILAILLIAGVAITTYKIKHSSPLVVIMMGPPGSGKGTNAIELAKTLNLPHISTGDLFRKNIKEQTDLGKKVKELIDKGNFVPDEIVIDMLFSYIKENNFKKGYILDGFPRTLNQAKELEKRIKGKVIVLNLNIDDSKLVERITGRLMCRTCGAPYHKTFMPPKEQNVCDKCKGELYQRDDDTKEVVEKRLEVYHNETEPLISYYKNKDILFNIDASDSKETVFENLIDTIEKSKV